MGRFINFLIASGFAIILGIEVLTNPAGQVFRSGSSGTSVFVGNGGYGGGIDTAAWLIGLSVLATIVGCYNIFFKTTTHHQPQPQPTTTQSTNNTGTTTESYEPEPEPEPVYEPDNPFSDVIEKDWSQDTGSDTGSITIDENPGRTRGDYQNIDPNIGADEPRISDQSQTPQHSVSTGYSEEEDDEFSPDIDVDLDDI